MMDYADMLLGGPKGQDSKGSDDYADLLFNDRSDMEHKQSYGQHSIRDPEDPASFGTILKSSLADDPQTQIRAYAKARFPDLPEEEAVKKYAIFENSQIAYYDDETKQWVRETPMKPLSRLKLFGGRMAGKGPTAIGGAVGGAMGGVPGAVVGGAAGEGYRKVLSAALNDEPQTIEGNVGAMAQEGILSGVSQGVGNLVVKGSNRLAARDLSRLDKAAMANLEAKAQQFDIPLTPAESSNLPSLKARQKALGNLSQSADDMADFYTQRGEKISGAVGKFLDDVSPTDSAEVAGKQIKGAAEKVYQEAIDTRRNWAKPIYEKVVKPENRIPSRKFKPIADDKYTAAIIEKVKADPLLGMEKLPNNSMPVLDATYKHFSDLIEVAKRSGENNRVRLLTQKQEALRSMMDDAFPDYANARMAFEAGSRPIEALDDSIVSVIKELPGAKFQTAAKRLFDPQQSGPNAVRQARALLEKADPDAWQSVKRSWLQQQWETAGREFVSTGSPVVNQGPKFRALLLGDEPKRRMMKEALSPQEWRTLNDLADVLEAAGRVKPVGSDTAWNQEMMRLARSEATPAYAKIARGLSPQKWGQMIEDWATERSLGKNAEQMAKIITSPGAAQKLKELRQLSPRSAQFRVQLTHFLTQTGRTAATDLEEVEPAGGSYPSQ